MKCEAGLMLHRTCTLYVHASQRGQMWTTKREREGWCRRPEGQLGIKELWFTVVLHKIRDYEIIQANEG